jgi:hypothetical protein
MPIDPEKQALQLEDGRRIRGAGGTPGGIGHFFAGLALAVVGGYLILNQVQVTSSYDFFGLWGWNRPGGFGLTMLPMLVGIGFLFFDGKSKLGWILLVGGLALIITAVLMSLSIHWAPTSLFNTIAMFGLLAGGIGLVVRSLRPYPAAE